MTVRCAAVAAAMALTCGLPAAAARADAPPSAPGSVSATAGDHQIVVSFQPPATSAGPVTGFSVTATPSGGGAPVTATGGSSPITVGGLDDGRSYDLTVSASTATLTAGPASPVVTATPFGAPGAPGPAQLLAGHGVLLVAFAPAVDGGAAITGYTATATPVTGGATTTVRGLASPLRIPGLRDGTSYSVTLVATNEAGPGPASPASPPAAPAARPALMGLHAPATVSYGLPFLVQGRVSQPGVPVVLTSVAASGGARVALGTAVSDGSGRFALHVAGDRTGRIRAAVGGLDADGAYVLDASTPLISVRPLVVITSAVVSGGKLTVKGSLRPGETATGTRGRATLSLWTVDLRGHRLARIGHGRARKAPRGTSASPFTLSGRVRPTGPVRCVVVVDRAVQSRPGASSVVTATLR